MLTHNTNKIFKKADEPIIQLFRPLFAKNFGKKIKIYRVGHVLIYSQKTAFEVDEVKKSTE